jgi:hypothetical protein
MKSVIVAWVNEAKKHEFESHVPLLFLGERNLSLGYNNDIDVVFIEGLHFLEEEYKNKLRQTGLKLIDASRIYSNIDTHYTKLNRFGNYEKKCFLRWLVLEQLYKNTPIIHYDGDIVFNEDPAKISRLFNGLTFCMQGCPAVLCISNSVWYDQYRQQLDLFHTDMETYSRKAWNERNGWEETKFNRWAGERHREIITSDQDLISHLIHTGRIMQENVGVIKQKTHDYFLIQNPLVLHEHQDAINLHYERIDKVDYINGKRVLVWHMQSDFNFYLALFLYRKKYTPCKGSLKFYENKENKLLMFIYKVISKITGHHERKYIYRQFFENGDFSKIFQNDVWWKKAVFS